MRRRRGLYSRVIAWLKILLPLVALAMLSTLFLLSRSKAPLQNVPFVEALQKNTIDQRVSAPYFAGTTAQGDVLTMTAKSVKPQLDGQILADGMRARMRLADGSEIVLDAAEAALNESDRQALMRGGVQITSSTGYVVVTDGLVSHLDRIEAESRGPVQGDGPVGRFEAGHLQIAPAGDDGAVQMLFSGGVKLVYHPPDQEGVAE